MIATVEMITLSLPIQPASFLIVREPCNAEGLVGLGGHRPARNGGKPKLSAKIQTELFQLLQRRSADGGLWTGPEVAVHHRNAVTDVT
ncbi:MAG: hypothetical protein JWN86_4145 [Planctomycetota bacterium]|nr:hypothetical protein [Planctomycetota bacterium]